MMDNQKELALYLAAMVAAGIAVFSIIVLTTMAIDARQRYKAAKQKKDDNYFL